MPAARSNPADLTGQRKAALAKQHEEELATRANELSMMTAAEKEAKKEAVDLTIKTEPEVEIRPVEVKDQTRRIRVNTDLEAVTIGHGNFYDFEVGREYIVPLHVAEHLDGLGYVWH